MVVSTRNRRIEPSDFYATFVEGQVVELIIGGPAMQVVDVCEDCGEVEAVHVNSAGDLIFNTFPPECLVAWEDVH
ncbi:MAG: hypothetical protein ACRER5_19240 [Pseudomonas sp.]